MKNFDDGMKVQTSLKVFSPGIEFVVSGTATDPIVINGGQELKQHVIRYGLGRFEVVRKPI